MVPNLYILHIAIIQLTTNNTYIIFHLSLGVYMSGI